jgi:pSer/pThr/pTyr-binding forkhead associated (FHA) protein
MSESSKGPRFSLRKDDGEVILPLVLKETLIGRLDSNHVVLDDPLVSRVHARVVLVDGAVEIEDCGSSRGTQVNGDLIDKAFLRHGDVVKVGQSLLEFLAD